MTLPVPASGPAQAPQGQAVHQSAPPSFQTQLNDFMAAERQQESGGNYQVINSIGAGGAYQFMPSTWAGDAKQYGYSQYANTPLNQVPPAVQDAVARAAMTSYYNQFGNWADVAKAWYAGGGFAQDNQTAPQYGGPSIDQYASDVMAIYNKDIGGGQSSGQAALNSAGQAQTGALQAGAGAQEAGIGYQATGAQAQNQVSQQELLNNYNNAIAQIGLNQKQLDVQGTGLNQQAGYTNKNFALQQQDLAAQLANLTAQYGFTEQQLGLSKQQAGQQYQSSMAGAESGLAGAGTYNTGTRAQTENPITQNYQDILANLSIQGGEAAQNYAASKKQLGIQGQQEGLSNTYQNQQIQNALAQLGLSRQGLGLQSQEAEQAYATGSESAQIGLQQTLGQLMQQYGSIFPTEAASAGNILSGLASVGFSGQ